MVSIIVDLAQKRITTYMAFSRGHWDNPEKAHVGPLAHFHLPFPPPPASPPPPLRLLLFSFPTDTTQICRATNETRPTFPAGVNSLKSGRTPTGRSCRSRRRLIRLPRDGVSWRILMRMLRRSRGAIDVRRLSMPGCMVERRVCEATGGCVIIECNK